MNKWRFATLLAIGVVSMAVVLSSCAEKTRRLLHLVELPDLSASIEPQAEKDALNALSNVAAAMQRGESATIIPIGGETADDDQGRVLRWKLPITREPFDGDLFRVSRKERNDMSRLFSGTRYRKTDIFGALSMAEQEFSDDLPGTLKAVVILSDFIEDDARYHFARDRRLRNDESALQFATQLAHGSNALAGVRVFLGHLASTDLRALRVERRVAVRIFWETFLTAQGAQVEIADDGSGRLERFLQGLRREDAPNPGPGRAD